MKNLLGWLLCCPVIAFAQITGDGPHASLSDTGIQFEKSLSWQEVRAKAKAENKYIFMDVNASWCVPCKMMEKNVFGRKEAGEVVNHRYISVKVQMDTAKNDNEYTRQWYADARELKIQYGIKAYPSFLFFSPQGDILHKTIGACDLADFKTLVQDALDSNNQYYVLRERYNRGERTDKLLHNLSNASLSVEDYQLFMKTSKQLIDRMSTEQMFEVENLKYIRSHTNSSKDRGFLLFYQNTGRINKLLGEPGNAEDMVEIIIGREEAEPFIDLKAKTVPSWDDLFKKIEKKYNRLYADRVIKLHKARYYEAKQQWPLFCKNIISYIDQYGSYVSRFALNNIAWKIFLCSDDKKQLAAAAMWMKEKVVPFNEGPDIDTYANLLYKMGQSAEAIKWEEKAMLAEPDNKGWQQTIDKMKRGVPTWQQD